MKHIEHATSRLASTQSIARLLGTALCLSTSAASLAAGQTGDDGGASGKGIILTVNDPARGLVITGTAPARDGIITADDPTRGVVITDKTPAQDSIITADDPSRGLIITDKTTAGFQALQQTTATSTQRSSATLAAASSANVVAVQSQPADNDGHASGPLAQRMAGSYLLNLELIGGDGEPFTVQALATLSADGGVVATDTDDFGLGTGAFFHSTKHGAWEATAKSALTITVIEFAYDASGNLTTLFRLVFDADYDDSSYTSGAGDVSFDAFLPGQDPLDADEPPVASGSGTFGFRKIVTH